MDLIRNLVDCSMFILIWLVQLIIYPSLLYSDPETFKDWHSRYMMLISIFVIPLMFSQVALVGVELLKSTNFFSAASAFFILIAWAVTFIYSAPTHNLLQQSGKESETISFLIRTNWPRTFAWTMVFILGLPIWRK